MLTDIFKLTSVSALIVGLASIFPVHQAAAQDAGANSLMLEEVVVTARRREESLMDTPVAVSAFTESDIDLRGLQNITDIADVTPNVNIDSAAGTSGLTAAPTVFIRGIGQADFVINTDPAVGIYVDGVYVARSIGSMMDLLDLERAEILRGPQGTLFGRNSLAGAVNLVSKRPTTEAFDAKFTAAAGERNYTELGGAFNFPIADTVAARLSLMKRQRDGYVEALQYDDFQLGDEDVTGARGQLEFLPTDNLRINFSADYSEIKGAPSPTIPVTIGNGAGDKTNETPPTNMNSGWWNIARPMGLPSFSGDPECATAEGRRTNPNCHGQVWASTDGFSTNAIWGDEDGNVIRPENIVEVGGAAATIEWDVGPGTLKSITARRTFESDFTNDNDYSPHPISNNVNSDFHQNQNSQELQFVGSAGDGKWEYTAGLYMFEETGTEIVTLVGVQGIQVTMGSSGEVFQSVVRDIDNSSEAIYGQLTYHFDAPLHLTLGVRNSTDEKTFDVTVQRDFSTAPGNTANGDGILSRDKVTDVHQNATGQAEWTETDPMVTLAWDASDTTMVYGTYSSGFRDGGFASRFPQGLPDPMPAFQPEYVDSFEVGVKSQFLDGNLRLNAALFVTNYDDLQVTAVPADTAFGGTGVNNVGSASMDGLEVEMNWAISETFRADFTLGLLDASIDSLLGGSLQTGLYTITTDTTLPYTPETNYTLGFTHRLGLGNGANITSRLDWIHTDDMRLRIEPNPDMFQEAFDRVNLSATYNDAGDDWALTFGIRNATDEAWTTGGSFSDGNGNSSNNVSRPREAYLRFQYWMGQ
jgi:iron complex outermembrane receptor protein